MYDLGSCIDELVSLISYLISKFKAVFFILFALFSLHLVVSLVKILCQPSRSLPEEKREAEREAKCKSKQAINECIWFTGDCSKCPYFDDCFLVRGGFSHDRS